MDIYEEMAIDSMDADEVVEKPMKHKEDLDEYDKYLESAKKRQKLSSDDTCVDIIKTKKRVTCSFDAGTFNNNIVRFILDNMVAFRVVESPSFRAIFDDLNIKIGDGTIKHLSRAKVVTVANDLILSQKNEIKNEIKTVEHVCLTADVWSSPTRSFMGVTAHWINRQSFERRSAALACRRFRGTHSYDRISEILFDISNEYDLNNSKVVGTVTDNCSNFVKAFRVFGNSDDISVDNDDEMETIDLKNALKDGINVMTDDYNSSDDRAESADRLDEDFNIEASTFPDDVITLSRHFRCASHTLNLIATTDTANFMKKNKQFETVHSDIVEKCEKVWKSLKSVKKREALVKHIGESIKRPNATRWNSFFDAFKQIYERKDLFVSDEVNKITESTIDFEKSDFTHIQHYLTIMAPLAGAIDKLQGDKNCHYGQLLPALITIEQRWLETRDSFDAQRKTLYKGLVDSLIRSLKKRFENIFAVENIGEFAAIAALTHPVYKKDWVKCLSTQAQNNVERLIQTKDQFSQEPTSPRALPDPFVFYGKAGQPTNLDKIITMKTGCTELLRFLAEPPTTNLLDLNRFPKIRKIFLKFNTILPSSAPVERLFSYATMMNLPKYNRLSDSQFENRVLYKVNLKKLYQ
ncbi:uncharacterized protein LOC106651121 [Trichogramma pretiosum]|uniref:uncharacterized protein LOC106651121 n=1 Tax=Trichogramma pretiosum TaxID=7493 RepID=UPI000C71B49C|nr:uncharacterized protein LOC106651121 [Trichogramma pretiosum]